MCVSLQGGAPVHVSAGTTSGSAASTPHSALYLELHALYGYFRWSEAVIAGDMFAEQSRDEGTRLSVADSR